VISFRYHLVSIIAVFLALALGIVIGTTALNGTITKGLRDDVSSLKKQRTDLNNQIKQLQTQVDNAGQFASTYGTQLVAGSLSNKSVLLIAMPGASTGNEDGIANEITAAGGKISGRVGLTNDYVDQRRADGIVNLATGALHPAGLTLPPTSDPGILGGTLLAWVLLGNGQQTDLTQVLSGFSELHMITTDGNDVAPSDSVVIIGNGSLPANGYASAAELSLIQGFQKFKGHVVVAGDAPSSSGGGVVASVRGSATRTSVSTVDDVDTPFGQVSTVLTLVATIAGHIGHYGTGSNSDALFPPPAK